MSVSVVSQNYIHRSGRTARAYKEGLSVMLVGPEDLKNYKKIIYTLNKSKTLYTFFSFFYYVFSGLYVEL